MTTNHTPRIHSSFLPASDPEASLGFYRDVLGWEVRLDVGQGTMRWITMGAPGQDASIVLHPPAVDPGISDDERRVITELMAKGLYGTILLASDDLEAVFAAAQAAGVEVISEPTDQQWGTRDCALRDPAGNTVRIQQA